MLNGFGDTAQIEAVRSDMASSHAVKVGYCGADISKPKQIAGMVEEATKTLGSVDILVNNAGVQFTARVEDFPDERWDQIIAINLSGVFHGMKAAIPGMKAKGWGRIINIASAHGLVARFEVTRVTPYVRDGIGVRGVVPRGGCAPSPACSPPSSRGTRKNRSPWSDCRRSPRSWR